MGNGAWRQVMKRIMMPAVGKKGAGNRLPAEALLEEEIAKRQRETAGM